MSTNLSAPEKKRRWRSGAKNNPPRSDRYTRTPLERLTGGCAIDPEITWNGTPCWLWQRYIDDCGYGIMRFGKENRAHRISYILNVGVIPIDKEIDHLCRRRHCVNCLHLEAVPHRVNMERSPFQMECIKIAAAASAKKARSKTHCDRGHELTKESTTMYSGVRRCRACTNEYAKTAARRNRIENPKPKITRVRITHCKNGHEFTDENARYTNGKRFCRACSRKFSYKRYLEIHPESKPKRVMLSFEGRDMSITDWAKEKGINVRTILVRRRYGWPIERILSEEVRPNSRSK